VGFEAELEWHELVLGSIGRFGVKYMGFVV